MAGEREPIGEGFGSPLFVCGVAGVDMCEALTGGLRDGTVSNRVLTLEHQTPLNMRVPQQSEDELAITLALWCGSSDLAVTYGMCSGRCGIGVLPFSTRTKDAYVAEMFFRVGKERTPNPRINP